ncbi:MAG: MBL fold metallo-hydrolase [FCB group bacterium]|nr:MBL fold metallo-hydrolase [FCB group bacterium]
MELIPLASGSRGNSYLIRSGKTTVLIDAGLSAKQLCMRLRDSGVEPESIDALFITHEHVDHIGGARVFSKQFAVPVFMNAACYAAACIPCKLEALQNIHLFDTGLLFEFQDIMIHPLSVSHDTSDPVCFTVSNGNISLGVITDLGKVSTLIHTHAKRLDALVLESNHDLNMLKTNTRYPEKVKQRIRSNRGHLSNIQAAEFARDIILHGKLRFLMLAHLSEQNNTVEQCTRTFTEIFTPHDIDLPFSFARQDVSGPKISL